CLITNCPRG
uniref:Locupressin n=1 Tax=Locusta migratoria TaxID=7004 RepID=DNF1_LOCMI|nr:RecName: Full=Locupressin; AltName: Full=Diuretic neuropeptide F1/F2 [Locusta migratoria]